VVEFILSGKKAITVKLENKRKARRFFRDWSRGWR
jgi:hypothetical protein